MITYRHIKTSVIPEAFPLDFLDEISSGRDLHYRSKKKNNVSDKISVKLARRGNRTHISVKIQPKPLSLLSMIGILKIILLACSALFLFTCLSLFVVYRLLPDSFSLPIIAPQMIILPLFGFGMPYALLWVAPRFLFSTLDGETRETLAKIDDTIERQI